MNDQLISWLMDAAAKAQGRGGGVPMGQQPSPFMPTPDALMAQREQEAKQILGQAYAPGQVAEAPLTPRDKFANVITGLADMLSAKAHAYNAAPPPDALNELRRRREERMMRDYAIGEEGKRAGLAAKQRVAEYELGQIEGEKERIGRLEGAKIKAEADIEQEKIKASSKEPKRRPLDDRRENIEAARQRGVDFDAKTEAYYLMTGELPKPPKDGKGDEEDKPSAGDKRTYSDLVSEIMDDIDGYTPENGDPVPPILERFKSGKEDVDKYLAKVKRRIQYAPIPESMKTQLYEMVKNEIIDKIESADPTTNTGPSPEETYEKQRGSISGKMRDIGGMAAPAMGMAGDLAKKLQGRVAPWWAKNLADLLGQ